MGVLPCNLSVDIKGHLALVRDILSLCILLYAVRILRTGIVNQHVMVPPAQFDVVSKICVGRDIPLAQDAFHRDVIVHYPLVEPKVVLSTLRRASYEPGDGIP